MAASIRISLASLSVLILATGAGSATAVAAVPTTPRLTSPDFLADGAIPTRFTCKGAGDRPTLRWTGVPVGATSISIVVTDPDAVGRTFTHWMVYGLPAGPSGSVSGGALPEGAHEQLNTAGKVGWKPPCPPNGTGVHHYHFVLYADRGPITGDGSPADTEAQITKKAIATASLVGTVAAS